MQLDMHFYGVYALARAAGIKGDVAEKIAYASQFVDDAVDQGIVFVNKTESVLPTMTSHRPIDYQNAIPNDQWNVWVSFHFLPGNGGENFYSRMTCEKGSKPAMDMLNDSLKTGNEKHWPHLIGITAHVFADTFSHHGFIGLCSDNNKVKTDSISPDKKHSTGIINYVKAKWEEFTTRFTGGAAEIVPVGHGAVGTFPDRPFLAWQFEYENSPGVITRDNRPEYLKACELLHGYFSEYAKINPDHADPAGAKGWSSIETIVSSLLSKECPINERIAAWRNEISAGTFCTPDNKDKTISYIEDRWRPRMAGYSVAGSLQNSDMCRFIQAAHRHRDYVLRELLPRFELITL
ncbi:MAG: hypothetical protein HY754_01770 [Nitrospirae bacterium]|nr:hypothetical protein [Nitrospirota bacterium]